MKHGFKQCLTVFADDFHCCEVFRSEVQLQDALHRIGILLDTLELLGAQLSLEKSHAIIKIGGPTVVTFNVNISSQITMAPTS